MAVNNAFDIAANTGAINKAAVVSIHNYLDIQSLTNSLGMLSGTVAANSAAIGQLTTQVAVLNEVAAPTVGLANALGLSVSTVSTISLAGSFTAPVLGVLMLVYVCWPDEKSDPWWNIESRVSQMINDKFNEERRKRLTERLQRYIKEFSRCSTAWIHSSTMVDSANSSSLVQHDSEQHVSSILNAFDTAMQGVTGESVTLEANVTLRSDRLTPPCMERLETMLSVERDEWMIDHDNSLSGLFMPFANLHTQIQAILTDFPSHASTHEAMNWPAAAQATAGEYAHYILTHMIDAWKNQMCRSVRMRYSPSTSRIYWQYMLVVLKPVWQPHAGQDCFDQCGSKPVGCNYLASRNP